MEKLKSSTTRPKQEFLGNDAERLLLHCLHIVLRTKFEKTATSRRLFFSSRVGFGLLWFIQGWDWVLPFKVIAKPNNGPAKKRKNDAILKQTAPRRGTRQLVMLRRGASSEDAEDAESQNHVATRPPSPQQKNNCETNNGFATSS